MSQAKHNDDNAARWFVELDRGPLDPAREQQLAEWLERDAEGESGLARCEAAVQLTRELQGDDEVRWAFAEAARLAETPRTFPPLSWYRKPALAWSVTAVAVVVAVGALWQRGPTPATAPAPLSTRSAVPAEIVRELAAAKPVVLSPDTANLVVEARSVAVLPFELAPGGDVAGADVAAKLYDDIVRELAAIPGVYVLGRSVVAPFADADIAPQEIAMQLSVRGIIGAQVAAAGGRVHVVLRIADAARAGLEYEQTFDRPTSELRVLGTEIVTTIAAALAAPVGAAEPTANNEE